MDNEKKMKIKEILEWVYCIVIAVTLALIVRYFVGTPTIVQQSSMYPTLKEGQRLILNRTIRISHAMPKRGDIVTFEAPSTRYLSAAQVDKPIAEYNYNINNIFSKFRYYILELGKNSYIKRVIGLPGEHVKIENGKVYINGEELKEDYLQSTVVTEPTGAFSDLVVPEGCIFVMGDNRSGSDDSRKFGCVPVEKLEGIVWIRFWPFNLFGKVD